ncbi:MAG: hypothetical protein M9913_17140 [Bryobacteraceae bacterium]|nr:hypothetical protein [Solibacteraceae bacterium]MCO5352593.1 hypothetical protein [Bryobacteraceae bacterium]
MAVIVTLQGGEKLRDSRAVINANFAAVNAAAGGKFAANLSGVTGPLVITHSLGTEDVIAQFWDANGRLAIADVQINGPNSLTVTFASAFTGRIVVRS